MASGSASPTGAGPGRAAGAGGAMSLRAGRQRSLNRIERTLLADDPLLASLFGIFTRLARDEAMPSTESVAGRPRRLRPALAAAIAVTAAAGVIMLSLLLSGQQACPGSPSAGPAHMQPFRRQASCPAPAGPAAHAVPQHASR
jgi:hypothetical protein